MVGAARMRGLSPASGVVTPASYVPAGKTGRPRVGDDVTMGHGAGARGDRRGLGSLQGDPPGGAAGRPGGLRVDSSAGGGGQQGQNTTGQNPGAIPSPLNLPKEAIGALPSFLDGGGGTASLASAGTSLTTAGTLLSSAAASLQAAGASLSTGIAGGGAPGFNPLSFTSLIPHAGGGDLTPGLDYLVGEQGPEPLHVDSSGSAFISPHSSLRESDSGKTTHIHNYDLRGADPATVQKLIAALPLIEERAVARAVNASSEISRRTANPS